VSGWRRAYREAPELFDAFARAEDPDGVVAAALRRRAGFVDRRVLELGCGTGRFGPALADGAGSWIGLDPEPAMVGLARGAWRGRPGMELVRGRGERLPFPDQSFDAAVATWVLGDLPVGRRAAVILSCDRVLRPDGALWLLENAGGCAFDALEGGRGPGWAAAAGFEPVEEVETELRFPDEASAARCLGYLLGDGAREALSLAPRRRFSHRVLILRRPRGRWSSPS